jgi:hypothetical protein
MTKGGILAVASIVNSTATVSNQLTVTIDQPLKVTGASGDSLTIWPGCPGRWLEDCSGYFGNANFRGFPAMPAQNPSIIRVPKTSGAGGKK